MIHGRMTKPIIQIKASNTLGKVPLYVGFHFATDAPYPTDSLTLDLGYDDELFPYPVEKLQIPLNSSDVFESYQVPDYHWAKVLYKEVILDSFPIHAISSKWVCGINFPYKYLETVPFQRTSKYIYLDTTLVRELGFSKMHHFLVDYRYFDTLHISGDHFEAESLAQNDETTGGKSCFDTYFVIQCAQGKVKLQFVEPGCEKYTHFELSDKKLDGRHTDLRNFGYLPSKPSTIRVWVERGRAQVWMDSTLVHEDTYRTALGKVKGLRIIFKGSGRLYSARVRDLNTIKEYRSIF